MKILSINAGSSSLKFSLFDLPSKEAIASGLFEKIGIDGSFYTIKYNGEKIRKEIALPDHSVAVECLINDLKELGIVKDLTEIEGVGHRMVHGGQEFTESVVLTEEILDRISKYNDLSPLHNPANILGVRAFMKVLPNVTNVGVFDTAFHQTMDEEHFLYPVPYEWYEKYGVRRYGFHGTSHRFVYNEICKHLNNDKLKVITCHIGNGGSITAIDGGKVIETSMGFTPIAGIMMGTRCGDIDPSILEFVAGKTGMSINEVTKELNKNSGYMGFTGVSSDDRDIEEAANNGNERCALARNMYASKIANFIAMYNNMLDGADAIILTAGLGENSITMREKILNKIKSLGVEIDTEKNNFRGEFRCITKDSSKIPVYVVPTNEELMIAEDTLNLTK